VGVVEPRTICKGLNVNFSLIFSTPEVVIFFFFFNSLPLSPYWPIRYLGGAAGLRGTFPGHPRPPSPLLSSTLLFFWTTRNAHNTTSMGGHPAWDSNPADLAVVSEECRSSSHHPTVSPC
jgi:hypothetical protein